MDECTEQRFRAKVVINPATGCLLWMTPSLGGYGLFRLNRKTQLAHRVAYQHWVGPIPDGLVIDHRCRQRSCVSPAHLEAVTQAENVRRSNAGQNGAAYQRNKKRCINGHRFDEANTYIRSDGGRSCRTCSRERARATFQSKPRQKLKACRRGHEFTPENTYVVPKTGQRSCRECKRVNVRDFRERVATGTPAPPRKKTHCRHGHEYTPENTYVSPSGRYRSCRTCWRAEFKKKGASAG